MEKINNLEGLSQVEAQQRLGQYGYNQLQKKEASPLLKFLFYFCGPIPWMIEIAVILSALIKDWTDFFIILALLVFNAIVGFWEEFQAGNTIAALKSKLALKAKVKRDGEWKTIPARELVPGDIIRLRIGDIIPADAKLLEGDPIEVDQSALTGESLPIERKNNETVYSGSVIKRGEIDALVTATGKNTYFGKTAQLVQEAHTVSHFQKAVLKIGDYLIVIAVVLVVLILAVALFRGDPMLKTLEFALVLTVAAIPVAMPTVLSVTMAVGGKVLAKKEAVVTRLASIEELAGINVLCSDKTGTLTQNKLKLGTPFTLNNVSQQDIILYAALASRGEDEDIIDLTVLGGLQDQNILKSYQILHFMPFDPVNKRTEATVKNQEGKTLWTTKGAPQVILALVSDVDRIRTEVEQKVAEFAARGFRSLAVANAEEKDSWRLLGIIPMFDPPRQDSKDMIKTAGDMGINVKMLTGDQLAIAREISGQLALGKNIIDANVFTDAKYRRDGELSDLIENADGFAQVFPEHKYHIV